MDAPVIAVVGATATGKSAVALALAQQLDGEIINADAMQFYRGMDIGTAKLAPSQREGVPHHQLDTLTVSEDASVAAFQAAARADIDAIHARGHRAIMVGGSGLYVRAALEQRAHTEGVGILFRELSERDPQAAAKMTPQNTKRIVRALEVIELTGQPYSASLPRREYRRPAVQLGLRLDYAALDPRIDQRVEQMWADGLVEEVRSLAAAGLRDGVTAQRAVGYAETLRHLDGEFDAERTRELIAQHTRRLARRQHRWFGPDPRVEWVQAPTDRHDVARATREALATLES